MQRETCMAALAVHTEVAHSLTASSLVQAFVRFVQHRRAVLVMCSECGSNSLSLSLSLSAERINRPLTNLFVKSALSGILILRLHQAVVAPVQAPCRAALTLRAQAETHTRSKHNILDSEITIGSVLWPNGLRRSKRKWWRMWVRSHDVQVAYGLRYVGFVSLSTNGSNDFRREDSYISTLKSSAYIESASRSAFPAKA